LFYSGICFGTNNLEEAGFFYDVVFKTIKVIRCQTTDNEIGYGYSLDQECFWVIKPYNKEPAARGNGSQMIITAKSKEEVDLFYTTALKAGEIIPHKPPMIRKTTKRLNKENFFLGSLTKVDFLKFDYHKQV